MKKDCGFKSKDSFYDRLLSTPNLAVQGEGGACRVDVGDGGVSSNYGVCSNQV